MLKKKALQKHFLIGIDKSHFKGSKANFSFSSYNSIYCMYCECLCEKVIILPALVTNQIAGFVEFCILVH